jgi:hypothetical protein
MERSFVCSWRRPNCRTQFIDLSLSALISWFMKSTTGFLNKSNLHAIISTSLIIHLHGLEEIYNNIDPNWSAVFNSRNHSITSLISFTKKRFRSEINSFCVWTRQTDGQRHHTQQNVEKRAEKLIFSMRTEILKNIKDDIYFRHYIMCNAPKQWRTAVHFLNIKKCRVAWWSQASVHKMGLSEQYW